MQRMPPEVLEFLTAELGFFDTVTDISGALYTVPKDERKASAVKLAREVSCPPALDTSCALYSDSNSKSTVAAHVAPAMADSIGICI